MFNKDIARANDARLLEIAKYIETNGTTKHIKNMAAVFHRFGYLKCLLRNGTFATIDDLEDSVYSRFGIVDKDLDSDGDSAIIAKMIEMSEDDLKALEDEEQKRGSNEK